MQRIFFVALFVLAIAAPTRAASLLLGTGETVSWNTSTQSSPTLNVSVQNPGGAVTDPVTAWQLGLAIAPEAGATGSVSFATFGPPSNYLLNGDSLGIISMKATAPVQLLVGDLSVDTGVVVPAAGANLLALTFSASSGTTGKFDIVTYGDPAQGSNWISGNDPAATPVAFGNVPFPPNEFPGPPVPLGILTVTQNGAVPEPQSALLLLFGGGSVLVYCRGRRRAAGLAG
jgi:hypothetical protein